MHRPVALLAEEHPEVSGASSGRRRSTFERHFLHSWGGLTGILLCSALALVAVFAAQVSPHDPLSINMRVRLQGPSATYWLGTDELGRDLLSRLIYGARVSLSVGAVAITIAVTAGVAIGLYSAYYRGWADTLAMRAMDGMAAFPAILIALAIMAALGPSASNAMIAIGVVYIPAFARIARGSALAVTNLDYVDAARALGAGDARIMWKTVLPNSIGPVLVHASLGFANAIIIESALSFLGLGVQPPTPSWGAMLNEGRQFMTHTSWYSFSAGAAIFLSVLGLNLLGDALRDAFDPHSRS